MVALPHPTTAGIPSSRATIAECDKGAPTSVTIADARGEKQRLLDIRLHRDHDLPQFDGIGRPTG
jgi:hypothetical protein